ncbi:MAG: HAD family hydrolase [Spirochaetota bacterium]
MKQFGAFGRVRGLLFDIDGTLYDNAAYINSHNRALVRRLALELGRSFEDTQQAVAEARDRLTGESGRAPSLANTFAEFGVEIETSAAWRSTLLEPECYLSPDERLRETLGTLRRRYKLAALTNNPADIAERTLRCLGVAEHFGVTVALDDTFVSKPDLAPFRAALTSLRLAPTEVVMIGDRYDVDIAPALDLGMAGILVEGVAEVYELPELLGPSE